MLNKINVCHRLTCRLLPHISIIVSASCLDHEGTISKSQARPYQGSRWEHMMPLLASSLSAKRPCAMTHVPTMYVLVRLNRSDSFAMAYSAWYLYRWHWTLFSMWPRGFAHGVQSTALKPSCIDNVTNVTNDKIVRTFAIGNLGKNPGFRLSSTS